MTNVFTKVVVYSEDDNPGSFFKQVRFPQGPEYDAYVLDWAITQVGKHKVLCRLLNPTMPEDQEWIMHAAFNLAWQADWWPNRGDKRPAPFYHPRWTECHDLVCLSYVSLSHSMSNDGQLRCYTCDLDYSIRHQNLWFTKSDEYKLTHMVTLYPDHYGNLYNPIELRRVRDLTRPPIPEEWDDKVMFKPCVTRDEVMDTFDFFDLCADHGIRNHNEHYCPSQNLCSTNGRSYFVHWTEPASTLADELLGPMEYN